MTVNKPGFSDENGDKSMETKSASNSKNKSGMSAKRLIIPIIILLAAMHIMIIVLIFSLNTDSNNLRALTQRSSDYTSDAGSILAGASMLSVTSSSFVMTPVLENGEQNLGPLAIYANEYVQDRRGHDVYERFKTYEVSDEVLNGIKEAAGFADIMMNEQLHAISLVNSVIHIPDAEPFNAIPIQELSEQELAMAPEARLAYAKQIISDPQYFQYMGLISQEVNQSIGGIQANLGMRSAQITGHIELLRTLIWIVIAAIMVIIIVAFVALYRHLVSPLSDIEKHISQDEPLREETGLREVRLLSSTYNGLLRRRDTIDDLLRSAAETDILTNLPNRFSFEQQVLDMDESGYSMAMVLFDVNFLKFTNDTKGHAAGDRLLKDSARCISDSFGNEDNKNCFRFGGDEFAAMLKNITEDEVKELIRRFREEQKQRNISISCGYGYTPDIGKSSIKALLDTADAAMYKQKKIDHAERDSGTADNAAAAAH